MHGVLMVDLGKTSCRGAVDGPDSRATAVGPGAPGLACAGGLEAAVEAVRSVAGALGHDCASVSVGAAGALAAPTEAGVMARRLVDELGMSCAVVAGDVITAHAGALSGSPGVVVVAGTGLAALAVEASGETHLVDGAGPGAGDVGSGGWLGARVLQEATSHDGTARALAAHRFGPSWRALAAREDPPSVRERASVVPDLDMAAEAGDPEAADLVRESAHAVAAAMGAAAATIPGRETVDACLVGGLTGLGDTWWQALTTAVARGARVRVRAPDGDALDGALLLARDRSLPHQGHVHRVGAGERP